MRERLAPPLLGVVGLFLIGTVGVARAATTPEQRCIAAKARAVAESVRAVAECQARDVEHPGSVGAECFVDARTALVDALARADELGPCGGVQSYLAQNAGACVPFLQFTPNHCAALKILAGANLAVAKLRCLARAGGGDPDLACLARAEARYRQAFGRAERRGPCPGTIDYIRGNPDFCLPLLAAAFRCGNGVIDRGEECDGQPFFCSVRGDCLIQRQIGCCFLGPFCANEILEACQEGGANIGRGTCLGTPCADFPGCTVGSCQDPPIAPTDVCCERRASCEATTETTAFDLRDALVACLDSGGQPTLGACGADGRCAR